MGIGAHRGPDHRRGRPAHTSWRGVFVLVSLASVVLMAIAALALRETLPVERRRRLRLMPVLRT